METAGQKITFVDVDGDGAQFDVAIIDMNNDGIITSDEVIDLVNDDIDVASLNIDASNNPSLDIDGGMDMAADGDVNFGDI